MSHIQDEPEIEGSLSQLKRLIAQYREKKWVGRVTSNRHTFAKRYTQSDILLLAQTDEAHQTLSGPATKDRARNNFPF